MLPNKNDWRFRYSNEIQIEQIQIASQNKLVNFQIDKARFRVSNASIDMIYNNIPDFFSSYKLYYLLN